MSTPVRPPIIANVNGISGTTQKILIAGNNGGGGDQSIAVIFHFATGALRTNAVRELVSIEN